jgi:ribosomal protein S17E
MNNKRTSLMKDRRKTIKQQRKDMLKKYEGKLSGLYDHLKEGVDYLDDIQRNKNKDERIENDSNNNMDCTSDVY